MKYIAFILTISFSTYLLAQDSKRNTSIHHQWYSSFNNNNAIKRVVLDAYQKEFGYSPEYDPRYRGVHSISFNEIERMCYDLINSDTCRNMPEDKRIQCDNLEEMSDLKVKSLKTAGFINSLGNMYSGIEETISGIFYWIKDTSSDEKIAQTNEVIDHVATAVDNEFSKRHEPTKRIIPFYNIAGRGIAWTGAALGTVSSGVDSILVDPIEEAYEAYSTRHCLNIEARASLVTQLTTNGVIEAVSFLIGGPLVNGTRKTAHFLGAARKFIGKTHKEAFMEIFENSKLTSTEIQTLVTGGRFDLIQDEEVRDQIKDIITDYLAQRYPDITRPEVIQLVNENDITNDILDVFQEIEILDNDGNPVHYIKELIDGRRTIENGQQVTRPSFFQQAQTRGVIGRVTFSRDARSKLSALNGDADRIKENFEEFITDMNNDNLGFDYLFRRWNHSRLQSTDIYHARIGGGHPTYVICYRRENDIINLFFFGTHEEAGLSYNACR